MMTNRTSFFLVSIGVILIVASGIAAGVNIYRSQTNDTTTIPDNKTTDPTPKMCGIQNCHGMTISCGPNVPDVCTEEYQLGDGCRQYASCEISNGSCQQKQDPRFTQCKNCVESCLKQFPNDPEKAFSCENVCVTNNITASL